MGKYSKINGSKLSVFILCSEFNKYRKNYFQCMQYIYIYIT